MFQTKVLEKFKKSHFMYNNIYIYIFENHSVRVIMWENMVESDRPQMATQRMCFAYWMIKATITHSV